ncbi:SGNH/GDSL hydrolase family protein [uncultured Streptococcus sp.]|jgi:lysophospholipase L1-like esterase|uniref:SGNH/GDSL hydrolase family protein n=1 Tax=uncultured Streptococcus sp. TaxID=83427 RepID=UPI0025DB54E2|nr:SGNH/GDSL hydrolase family protein [uncultured Streptococcus sp.]
MLPQLTKEQENILMTYRKLNQAPLKEPGLIFLGDSIVEYFPIHELLQSPKYMVNRGVRGYRTDLLQTHLDAHVFGTELDQIFLLIGTNDIGKEIPQKETLDNVEAVLQAIMRDFPLTKTNLISVLPVSQEERYKQKVSIRSNKKIQDLNQAYQELAQAYHQVSYVDVYSSLLDEVGQLAEAYTTDGLHLSVAGYRILAQALQEIV